MVDPVCVCVCVCACSYVGLGSPASQGLTNPSGYCCQSPNSLSLRLPACCPLPAEESRSPAPEWYPEICLPFLRILEW